MDNDDDEPPDDGVYAPAPSPEDVAAACTGPGGWTAKQLALWGIAWPPPAGWRAELARKHELGLDVRVLPYRPSERQRRKDANRDPAPAMPEKTPAQQASGPAPPPPTLTTDHGTVDPLDPPPWL